jgi:nucleoside-diphosphate-sugar epimerase
MRDDVGSRTILVIGGSGFIGRAVVQQLVSTEACKVVAASRKIRVTDNLQSYNLRWTSCDVMDQSSVVAATDGIDCVINCYRDDVSEAESAKAIANILNACETNKVKKLIYFSSVAIYGGASGNVDEWTPPLPPINWYGRAKSQAERACQSKASPSFHVAILRPTIVYGPGGEEWFLRFMRSIKSGALGDLGANGEGIANLIYVDDLARMCSKLALSPMPQFSISIANGCERVTFNDYFNEIRRALGRDCDQPSPQLELLRKVVSKCRRPARVALKFLRLMSRPLLGNSNYVERLFSSLAQAIQHRPEDSAEHGYCGNTYFSSAQAQALGLHADTRLREGVARAMEWQRARGLN